MNRRAESGILPAYLRTERSGMEVGSMERVQQEAVIESILFAMGDSVETGKLAEVLEEDKETVRGIVREMKEKWEKEGRGVSIAEFEDSFQMCTRGDLYEYLVKVAKTPRKYVLTDSLMETLSIVAYKQPVTRLDIERIRGVNSDHAVNRLIELELVTELGRMDAPGRPLLFGTTEQFLRSFGVKSLEELPKLNEGKLEEFRAEAEEEAKTQLKVET